MLKPVEARPTARVNVLRWAIGFIVIAGLAGWFMDRPDPRVLIREKTCRSWGISDPKVLTACRESSQQQSAALAPLKRALFEQELAAFNAQLAKLPSHTNIGNEANYPKKSVDEIAKITGGVMGFFDPGRPGSFPATGQRVRLTGLIVTNVPDLSDDINNNHWEPRYFTLWATEREPAKDSLPNIVSLDIESLDRYERQFIIDHCVDGFISMTPCRATVLGHLGEVVERRSDMWSYKGVVADQVDIEPLNSRTANQNGMPSMQSLIQIHKRMK